MNINLSSDYNLNTISPSSSQSNFESQSAKAIDNRELIQTAHTQAIQTFEEISILFKQFYYLATQVRGDLSSEHYGALVKLAEEALIKAKDLVEAHQDKHIIEEMEKQFEDLCTNMPLGKSVLLQKDVDKINSLGMVSINETYKYKENEYYEPHISLLAIANYFEDFKKGNGYSSIAVSMKRDIYYHMCKGKMFTLIGFRKTASSMSTWSSKLSTVFKMSEEEKIINQMNQLRKSIKKNISRWGYEGFTLFHMDKIKHVLDVSDKDEWGASIFLFHRKVGNENLAMYEEDIFL
ncbi:MULTISPECIES: hypothetical protein [unclassified Neochlamydia]|uniref:hypothetical protein n=1 Tax=unclassified Neochlamydia TaxID=2643326 RepID=UPI00140CD3A3|nr:MULTISPECIES: hypothetical protein [unclassified Neochlamydia]MBS4167164.1 hypothetical protein [Neochlamydia sp. AcF65]MBS4169481.1 hypothetical protein [Neochlamydia sp. AcF95]NGY95235.1 hypothetical protein [Neochlamydia sp. AcF84]